VKLSIHILQVNSS